MQPGMGLLSLPEAVNAPTNGLLIAIRGNFIGDCSQFSQQFYSIFYVSNFRLFLCLEFDKAREIIL